jgi:uncharacterized protein
VYHYPDPQRSANPTSWPQYPYDRMPSTPEMSEATYSIVPHIDHRLEMSDGTLLAYDVYRPYAPRQKFPALIAYTPYNKMLSESSVPMGMNEAGITEFWVPRGYLHVIVDARGTGDSEGSYDLLGDREQQDLYDLIEQVASLPWCDGNVGMIGCSYFAMVQWLAAAKKPPSLKAIFPYDPTTDLYREFATRGGAFQGNWDFWVPSLFGFSGLGERTPDPSGMLDHARYAVGRKYELDGPFWRERSATERLGDIDIPTYMGCDWGFQDLHLRGTFEGWEKTRDIPKRLAIGGEPKPRRLYSTFHIESLRWYDHWLKGKDTGVMVGLPINLFIQGPDTWRAEEEWPLARTQWVEYYLGGNAGSADGALSSAVPARGSRSYDFDPHSVALVYGDPKLVYRTEPFTQPTEVTGPMALYLSISSSVQDTDFHVRLLAEGPNGERLLSKGALKASHRALDEEKSTPWQPYHPHDRKELLEPGEEYELAIELWPTCYVFQPGERIRLEIASSPNIMYGAGMWVGLPNIQPPAAHNTVIEGGDNPARLVIPVIPAR